MTIDVHWYDVDEEVLIYRFNGEWTSDEFREAVSCAAQLSKEKAPKIIHTIVDMADTNSVPFDLFSQIPHVRSNAQPNGGLIVVVHAPNIFVNVIRMMLTYLPNINSRIRMVDSMEEALTLVNLARATTGDAKMNLYNEAECET